jgi:hypothetical protein
MSKLARDHCLRSTKIHLLWVSIETPEILLEKLRRLLVGMWIPSVIWEIPFKRRQRQLVFEEIDLVEEEDYRCLDEPLGVAYALEKHKSFLHLILPDCSATASHVRERKRMRTASLSSTKHWS